MSTTVGDLPAQRRSNWNGTCTYLLLTVMERPGGSAGRRRGSPLPSGSYGAAYDKGGFLLGAVPGTRTLRGQA